MKLSFDSLFSAKIQDHRFILLFGNDEGVIQRGLTYVLSHFSKVTLLEESEFLGQSAAPQMGDLFGEPTPDVYLIDNCGERALKILEGLNETKNTYIFTSLKLRATSKVTTWITRHGVSIGCYESPLGKTEFSHLVRDLNLSNDLKTQLYQRAQKTPQRLQQIISLLNIVDKSSITTSLIDDLWSEDATASETYQSLSLYVLCKDKQKIAHYLNESPLSSTDVIPFLRTLLRCAQTLYEMKSGRGHTLSQRPFFKDEPFFQRALPLWSCEDINKLLNDTLNLEQKMKFSPGPLLLENFLLFK